MELEQRKYYDFFTRVYNLQNEIQNMSEHMAGYEYEEKIIELANVYAELGEHKNAVTLLQKYMNRNKSEKILNRSETLLVLALLIVELFHNEEKIEFLEEYADGLTHLLEEMDVIDNPKIEKIKLAMICIAILRQLNDGKIDNQTLEYIECIEEKFLPQIPQLLFLNVGVVLLQLKGEYHYRLGNYVAALEYYKQIEDMSWWSNYEEMRIKIYHRIMQIYEEMGKYRHAYLSYEKYHQLRENLYHAKNYAYSDYLISLYGIDDNKKQMKKLWEEKHSLEEQIYVDALTGLYNRKYLKYRAKDFTDSELKMSDCVSAIMFDIDFFKNYNDNYGHVKGDIVLKKIGELILTHKKKNWLPVRYGGEEFLLVIENDTEREGEKIAKQMVELIRAQKIPHEYSPISHTLTISAGVASGTCLVEEELIRIVEQADKALYTAKEAGRNQYKVFEQQ